MYIYLYSYIKRNLYGRRCLEVNNLASCWQADALSVSEEEEEGKTALQIDTMASGPTGEEGTEAEREAKRRKANTTNRGEIVTIS